MKRLTEEGKKDIARKIIGNQLYPLSNRELELGCAMPLLLGALDNFTQEEVANIGAVLGLMDSIGERTLFVNGSPIFSSVMFIHKDDWPQIIELVKEVEEAKEKILSRS